MDRLKLILTNPQFISAVAVIIVLLVQQFAPDFESVLSQDFLIGLLTAIIGAIVGAPVGAKIRALKG